MAVKSRVPKQSYVKGSQGSKPTPLTIPNKPISFQISQNTGLFPSGKPGK
jgi:hypothetical protein